MGILDDTIREHLELKRKHGARDAELKQLEDEAFGPPSRPGEPDFPERPPTGEEEAVDEASAADATRILSPDEQSEPAVTAPPEGSEEEAAIGPEAPEERSAPAFFDQGEAEEEPSFGAVEAEATEHAIPEPGGLDTVEHPAPEPSAAKPSEEDELEVGEIELELSEEFEEFREVEGATEGEPRAGETDEHAPVAETDENAPLGETDEHGSILVHDDEDEEGFTDERDAVLADEDEPHAEDDDDEDVLEETPEFLRDTPEDERLWFEQGEPRDFDFDDD